MSSNEMSAVEYLRMRDQMCKEESGDGKKCENCPLALNEDPWMSCADVEELNPEKAVRLVKEWADTHCYPTWNEWLHDVYSYYNGFNTNLSYLDWLNTTVTKEEATHWNIPLKKDLHD